MLRSSTIQKILIYTLFSCHNKTESTFLLLCSGTHGLELKIRMRRNGSFYFCLLHARHSLVLDEETEAHGSKASCSRRWSYLHSITLASHQWFQKWLCLNALAGPVQKMQNDKWGRFLVVELRSTKHFPKIPVSHPFGSFLNKNKKPHSQLEVELGLFSNILVLNILHNCSLLCTSGYWFQ